jgi:hypothetical protein
VEYPTNGLDDVMDFIRGTDMLDTLKKRKDKIQDLFYRCSSKEEWEYLRGREEEVNKMISLLQESQDKEDRLNKEWALGAYIGECPKCHRDRLCACDNGKSRCEKCNWVPEDDGYCEVTNG